MEYKNIVKGIFLSRPNRFTANVLINGNEETVHVKNTGRCKELLIKGCTVYLFKSDNPNRKTEYDLIGVEKLKDDGSFLLINMDSQIPNDVANEWLLKGNIISKNARIKREYTFGKSRFDFYMEDASRKIFLEVKGVTLEEKGIALFPDAPTLRGVKHIKELENAVRAGYEAYILFIIQMKGIKYFTPNCNTHKEFAQALKHAKENGVKISALDCTVTENSITADKEIPVKI